MRINETSKYLTSKGTSTLAEWLSDWAIPTSCCEKHKDEIFSVFTNSFMVKADKDSSFAWLSGPTKGTLTAGTYKSSIHWHGINTWKYIRKQSWKYILVVWIFRALLLPKWRIKSSDNALTRLSKIVGTAEFSNEFRVEFWNWSFSKWHEQTNVIRSVLWGLSIPSLLLPHFSSIFEGYEDEKKLTIT